MELHVSRRFPFSPLGGVALSSVALFVLAASKVAWVIATQHLGVQSGAIVFAVNGLPAFFGAAIAYGVYRLGPSWPRWLAAVFSGGVLGASAAFVAVYFVFLSGNGLNNYYGGLAYAETSIFGVIVGLPAGLIAGIVTLVFAQAASALRSRAPPR